MLIYITCDNWISLCRIFAAFKNKDTEISRSYYVCLAPTVRGLGLHQPSKETGLASTADTGLASAAKTGLASTAKTGLHQQRRLVLHQQRTGLAPVVRIVHECFASTVWIVYMYVLHQQRVGLAPTTSGLAPTAKTGLAQQRRLVLLRDWSCTNSELVLHQQRRLVTSSEDCVHECSEAVWINVLVSCTNSEDWSCTSTGDWS
ncbi:hypothetical protein CEXT_89041 [Caerostris extrusa]|uniref:Uncharacterized protein n=1 Tax=Caerostris extrusa TaxID=172846 RepID=A0AAV4T5X8_CAEEX|nr:hypothetical protein CEXT_89041 [Caerostris extrusa]